MTDALKVDSVIGLRYRGWDGRIYVCMRHDDSGFLMRSEDEPVRETYVSERAIDRTYHRVGSNPTYRTHAIRISPSGRSHTNGEHDTLEAAEAETAALLLDGWTCVQIRKPDGTIAKPQRALEELAKR